MKREGRQHGVDGDLRRLTQDPVRVLNNIQAARAFTCYQVMALLEETANRPIQYPVLIFDLLATFYDESVSYHEGYRLLEQSVRCISFIHRLSTMVISVRPPMADFPERSSFLERVCNLSDVLWVEETPQVIQPKQLSFLS